MKDCSSCEFCVVDYVYNTELCEEYEKYCCEKGHDTDCEQECKDYKQDEPQEYVEEFTKCDDCEFLQSCINNGVVIEITHRRDSLRHYTNKIGYECNMTKSEKDGNMSCNLKTCRHNENGKCTSEEDRKNCVDVSKKVLCVGESEEDEKNN